MSTPTTETQTDDGTAAEVAEARKARPTHHSQRLASAASLEKRRQRLQNRAQGLGEKWKAVLSKLDPWMVQRFDAPFESDDRADRQSATVAFRHITSRLNKLEGRSAQGTDKPRSVLLKEIATLVERCGDQLGEFFSENWVLRALSDPDTQRTGALAAAVKVAEERLSLLDRIAALVERCSGQLVAVVGTGWVYDTLQQPANTRNHDLARAVRLAEERVKAAEVNAEERDRLEDQRHQVVTGHEADLDVLYGDARCVLEPLPPLVSDRMLERVRWALGVARGKLAALKRERPGLTAKVSRSMLPSERLQADRRPSRSGQNGWGKFPAPLTPEERAETVRTGSQVA